VKVVPLPGRLSTWMTPLCSSMIWRVTANPRPVPCALVVKNGSKNRRDIFRGDAHAGVCDLDAQPIG